MLMGSLICYNQISKSITNENCAIKLIKSISVTISFFFFFDKPCMLIIIIIKFPTLFSYEKKEKFNNNNK